MSLDPKIHRCIGVGTEQGNPDAECLECERRTAGIFDYVHGVRGVLWMAPIEARPCPEMLAPRGKRE